MNLIKPLIILRFNENSKVKNEIDRIEREVTEGIIPPTVAAENLLSIFFSSQKEFSR